MDLWIRSQDKKRMIKVEHIDIAHKQEPGRFGILDKPVETEECYILVNGRNFGEYKNEQRAIEVLDEIQKFINHWGNDQVYQMPADDTPPAPKNN